MGKEKERWKPIPVEGFEHLYEVSDQGRLRRVAASHRYPAGMIVKPVVSKQRGNYCINVLSDGKSKKKTVSRHRLVLEAFVGPCSPKHETNHKNGKKGINQLSNLEWATKSKNCLHRSRVLGKLRGSKHGRAKLTERQVRAIRRRLARGETQISVAARFGVGQVAVSLIHRRINWSHLE